MANKSLAALIDAFCSDIDQYIWCYKNLTGSFLPASAPEWQQAAHVRMTQWIRRELEKRWLLCVKGGESLAKTLERRGLTSFIVLRTLDNLKGEGKPEYLGDPWINVLPSWNEDKLELKRLGIVGKRSPANREPEQKKEPMRSLGNRNYAVGKGIQIVDETEESVLETFFCRAGSQDSWVAIDKPLLLKLSGYDSAPRILQRIKKKYPLFDAIIDCPGRKGRGGYKIFVAGTDKKKPKNN